MRSTESAARDRRRHELARLCARITKVPVLFFPSAETPARKHGQPVAHRMVGDTKRRELDSHVFGAPESGRPSAFARAPIWDQERLQRGEMVAKAAHSARLRGLDRKPATGSPDPLSGAVTGVEGESRVRLAGKQPPAGADAACPALTASPANPLDMPGLTDPSTEGGLKVLRQLQPSRSGDADPLQDRRQILGDGPALVVAYRRRRILFRAFP